MRIKITILLTLLLVSIQGISQEKKGLDSREYMYTDFVADENGNRLAGITVSVRGKRGSTRTNFNGEFSIKATIGDIIVLSKNGREINSYTYDGSLHYEIEDKSISKSFKSKTSNSNHFETQLDSANNYVKSDPFKSISFVENALKSINSKRGNSVEIAKAYAVLGDVYLNLKQYDLAESNYGISLKNKSDNSVKLKLANAYSMHHKVEESSEVLLSLDAEKLSVESKIEFYTIVGANYKLLQQIDKAILNISKGLKIAKDNAITAKVTTLNSELGALHLLQGNTDLAQHFFSNTIDASKNESLNKRAIVTNAVANQYGNQKDFDKEIELKKQTLQELEDANVSEIVEIEYDDKITVQQLNLDIGNAYANKKSFDEAIDYLEKSKVDADKVDDHATKKEAVQQLSEIYKNVGDYNKALNSYQEYVGLVDILYKEKEREIEEAVSLNNDLAEKQNRINSLEKDRELSESKNKLYESEQQFSVLNYKRQRLIIYFLLVGLLLLLTAVYFMYKSNKQRRLANNILALKSLRSQMNPHFIFNALNSVNSFIAQNDERTANRYLTDFSTLMRSVLNNSEEDFIPLAKEIELLELYIKLEHSRFRDKFDYKISIDKSVRIGEFQIPPMLLQPYVENAVWHGLRYKKEKGILKITLQQKSEESLTIEISDDGIGRLKSKELKTENQQKQQSKGMANIKSRIAILNEMYRDKVAVVIEDLYPDNTGTKVVLTLKKD